MASESDAIRNRVDLLGMSAESIGRLVRATTLHAVATDFAGYAIRERQTKSQCADQQGNAEPGFEFIENGKPAWAKDVL